MFSVAGICHAEPKLLDGRYPTRAIYRCSSEAIGGIVRIEISKPVQRTVRCYYYDMTINSRTVDGKVEVAHVGSDGDDPNASARICDNDGLAIGQGKKLVPSLEIQTLGSKLVKSEDPNACYLPTIFSSLSMTLDPYKGKVSDWTQNGLIPGGKIALLNGVLNSRAVMKESSSGIFILQHPFLNGVQCSDVTDFQSELSGKDADICRLISYVK